MLNFTEAATKKLKELIARQTEPVYGLRVIATQGGCSGHSYGVTFAEQAEEGDWMGEFAGVKVVVDRQSAPLLSGACIDYVETLQSAGFTISNPKAAPACSCGSSCGTEESQNQSQAHQAGEE
jgi:iron-sulfur cluster assembly accessory protein